MATSNVTNTSPVQRINQEDLPGAPAWVGGLISPINLFIQSTNSALAGNLQLGTNVNAQINKVTFITNSNYINGNAATFTPITFKSTLSFQQRILLIGQINIIAAQTQYIANTVAISDWTDNNGVISINFIAGLSPNTEYSLTTLGF
jgi:hypothetical protein